MSKNLNKQNITVILHDIKEEYARKFHEKIPVTPEMEQIIIIAAKQVKRGGVVEWYLDEKTNAKKLKINFPPKKVYVPYKKKYVAPKK